MSVAKCISEMRIREIIDPHTGKVYSIDRYLGVGSVSDVYEVISGDKHYASKMTSYMKNYKKELEINEIISHLPDCKPYIVCLCGHFTFKLEDTIGVLLLEVMKNTLDDIPLMDSETHNFVLDILKAVVTLHAGGITHNDIHVGNIFRLIPPSSDNVFFKLGDFSRSVINATSEEIQNDDLKLATTFLTVIYKIKPSVYVRGIPDILREEFNLRRESDIPSDAIETMIRGMLNPNVSERWSSEKALDYILSVIQ